jgi:hypothetical protein
MRTTSQEHLSTLERVLLIVPLLGAVVFGILPLFFSQQFASVLGFTGNDVYLYRLAGAVTLGYVPGLLITILSGAWTPARLVIVATLVFNIGSLFAIAMAILAGGAQPVVYAILVTSLFIIGLTAWLLNSRKTVARPAPDVARWVVYLIVFLTAAAFGTGTLFLLAPLPVSQLFGFIGTDEFVFRQGGAATLGFAVMGVFELRSRSWQELRLPNLNALLFNGASLIATVVAIVSGDPILLLAVVLLVTAVATVGCMITMVRQGN